MKENFDEVKETSRKLRFLINDLTLSRQFIVLAAYEIGSKEAAEIVKQELLSKNRSNENGTRS